MTYHHLGYVVWHHPLRVQRVDFQCQEAAQMVLLLMLSKQQAREKERSGGGTGSINSHMCLDRASPGFQTGDLSISGRCFIHCATTDIFRIAFGRPARSEWVRDSGRARRTLSKPQRSCYPEIHTVQMTDHTVVVDCLMGPTSRSGLQQNRGHSGKHFLCVYWPV
ncbi:uncharacterized protein [Saccopteryx leptura]|uniref:uncharacterized protein isoform X1 n=1 Tax=Saccopteryx leptura TaxID=249018 RepID=UPI00339CDD07